MYTRRLALLLSFIVLVISCSFFQNRKLKLPSPEKKKSQEAVAAQIFEYQNKVNQCTRAASVTRIEIDASQDDFVKLMSSSCTHEELIQLSRYWFCFQKQLTCPVKWAESHQKAGDNCLPLPKLSEKCCSVYEIEWLQNGQRRRSTCSE